MADLPIDRLSTEPHSRTLVLMFLDRGQLLQGAREEDKAQSKRWAVLSLV